MQTWRRNLVLMLKADMLKADVLKAEAEKVGASSHSKSLFCFGYCVPSPPPELNKGNLEGDNSVEAEDIHHKRAFDIHAPVWKLKQGDTFSDWKLCRDWFQGAFPPNEIKFQKNKHMNAPTAHTFKKLPAPLPLRIELYATGVACIRNGMPLKHLRNRLLKRKQRQKTGLPWGGKRKSKLKLPFLRKSASYGKKLDNYDKRTLRNEAVNLKAEIERLKKEKADAEAAQDEAMSHRDRS
ncbi:hypothetical protein Hanom_Chr04g00337991 [Helianthus anomalus]